MPSSSPACDRCSRRKERCLLDPGALTCRRCDQQGAACTFTRRQRRMGRRPRTHALPYGRFDILNLDADDEQQQQQHHHHHHADRQRPPSSGGHDMPTPADSGHSASPGDGSADSGAATTVAASSAGASPDLPADPNLFVWKMLNEGDVFYRFHRNFMIGRSFQDSYRGAVRAVSPYANGILLEAYRATLGLWDLAYNRIKPLSDVDMSGGTDCLRILQVASTTCKEDAAALLMTGQVLIVHHVAVMRTSAHSIVRSVMLQVRPFYRDLMAEPEMDPITVTPILVDTIESLARRESPIIRTDMCDRFIVDRSLGVCWTLLSLLQELCDCSVRAREAVTLMADGGGVGGGRDLFTDVEDRIRRWEPNPPPSLFTEFTSAEVSAMLLQARLYRIAALLIVHRLRYPLGVRDADAVVGARTIFAELDTFFAQAPQDMKSLPIGLPLLVAMLEIKEPGEHIMGQMTVFLTDPWYAREFRRFVDLVWDARRGGFRSPWFELATRFQMPLLP